MEEVEELKEVVALSGSERDGACGHKCGCHQENGFWITPRKEIEVLTPKFCIENVGKRFLLPHSLHTQINTLISAS